MNKLLVGIASALVRKAKTGEGALVDGSLLGTAMWCMQMAVVGSVVAGVTSAPPAPEPGAPIPPPMVFNPLTFNYKTSDDRWVALCMLQPDLYFDGLVKAVGREDMATDERFVDHQQHQIFLSAVESGRHMRDLFDRRTMDESFFLEARRTIFTALLGRMPFCFSGYM